MYNLRIAHKEWAIAYNPHYTILLYIYYIHTMRTLLERLLGFSSTESADRYLNICWISTTTWYIWTCFYNICTTEHVSTHVEIDHLATLDSSMLQFAQGTKSKWLKAIASTCRRMAGGSWADCTNWPRNHILVETIRQVLKKKIFPTCTSWKTVDQP